jgi:hypothetical protein
VKLRSLLLTLPLFLGLLVAAGPVHGQATNCTQLQGLINAAPGDLRLPRGSYNNTCGQIAVPAGFQLSGAGDGTVIHIARTGDPVRVGKGAHVAAVRFQVDGAANDVGYGQNPCGPGCGGIVLQAKATVERVRVQGTWRGFSIQGDHVRIHQSTATKNGSGVYQAAGQFTYGNTELWGNDLTGNTVASILIGGHELDSADLRDNHLGFTGACWKADAGSEYAVTNLLSTSDSCEQPHHPAFAFGTRKAEGLIVQPHTLGQLTWQSGGPVPSRDGTTGLWIQGAGGNMTNGPLLGLHYTH